MRPGRAWISSARFLRAFPRARSARRSGSVSPAIKALRIARPLCPRTSESTLPSLMPGVQERPDEFEHALVGHPCGDARHQDVVVNSVEKSFQIEIHHNVVALGDVALCLGYGLMRRPSRPEAVAVLGERRIPL